MKKLLSMRKLTIIIFILIMFLNFSCSRQFLIGFANGIQGSTTNQNIYNRNQNTNKCPSCGKEMYFTGKTKVEFGRLLKLYNCYSGHAYWIPDRQNVNLKYVNNPCPICNQETYFSGKTYIENGKLMKVYVCPLGHKSVQSN